MRINRSNAATTAVSSGVQASSQLTVVVPYTTPTLTRTALKYVAGLGELAVNVHLIDAHVVPFPVPVSEPTVRREFLEERLRTAAEETALLTRAQLVFTRDRAEALGKTLKPGSLIVIAARGWWWFSAERKLARLLTRAGHEVVMLTAGRGGKLPARRLSRAAANLVR